MFTHTGETRTYQHNLRIASLLSFVAGMVNVAGFLSVQRLTTNVTGHFAFLIDEVFKLNFIQAFVFLLYILFFLLGSFTSGFLVEFIYKKKTHNVYVFPALIQSLILFTIPLVGEPIYQHPDMLACSLLYAMGLQNSLVTSISKSIVRTTHLTGLFTDLGIELSQLFFYKEESQRNKLFSSIKLRLTIISYFFIGGVVSGVLYSVMQVYILMMAGFILIAGVTFDYLKPLLLKTR